MTNIIVKLLIGWIDKVPMGSYRTYVINIVLIVAWGVFILFGGDPTVAAAAIGISLSNLFQRKSNETQTAKMVYIESLLQGVTQHMESQAKAKATVDVVPELKLDDLFGGEPTGPEADTRPR